MIKIEYKVRQYTGKLMAWEEIRTRTIELDDAQEYQVDDLMEDIAYKEGAREIRWNWEGGLQGHYVKGPNCGRE